MKHFTSIAIGSPLSPSQFAEVFQFGPGATDPPQEDVSDVTNLNCMILMLDLVVMQVSISEICWERETIK